MTYRNQGFESRFANTYVRNSFQSPTLQIILTPCRVNGQMSPTLMLSLKSNYLSLWYKFPFLKFDIHEIHLKLKIYFDLLKSQCNCISKMDGNAIQKI